VSECEFIKSRPNVLIFGLHADPAVRETVEELSFKHDYDTVKDEQRLAKPKPYKYTYLDAQY